MNRNDIFLNSVKIKFRIYEGVDLNEKNNICG